MEANQSATLYNVASLVMVLALVADFIWVISTAVHAMK
jgi:hypothetical protein